MITSVYLSNNNVRVAAGSGNEKRARVKKVWELQLQEGSLINGIITNEAELSRQLEEFWRNNRIPGKNVKLVLESSRLITKQLELPKLKEKQIYELLPREFENSEEETLAMVYDYMPMLEGVKGQIRAVATEREYIAEFLELFHKIGVSVGSITLGRSSLLQVLNTIKGAKDRNVVFQILDGNSMTSILCMKGKVEYSTQRRIFAAEGEEAFAQEIARSVSSLQQFLITQKITEPITDVWLAGLPGELLGACRESIRTLGEGISVKALELDKNIKFPGGSQEAGSYLFAIGGLMAGRREINLVKAISRKAVKKKERSAVMGMLALPLILLLGGSLITGSLYLKNHLKQLELDGLNEYLQAEDNIAQAERASVLKEENASLARKIASVEYMNGILDSYPSMNSSVVQKIENCAVGYATISVTSYTAESGMLSIDAKAENVELINQFIDRLQETGLFQRLDYTGYTYDQNTNAYTINVNCYLAELAGK